MWKPIITCQVLAWAATALCCMPGCTKPATRVVVYCAQDPDFANQAFDSFTKQTGLTIGPRWDTEANKSVSLYYELIREKDRPRCDVFWNNEILSTLRLDKQNLLEPYDSPSAKPYPAWTKGKDYTWHAFATRARVLLVNTRVPEKDRPASLLDLTDPRWKGQVAMAKPMAGTSATQAVCLFEVLGPAEARKYYEGLNANAVQILAGNKDVALAVGRGEAAIGITDTDDAMAEVKAGHPVVIIYPDRAGSKTHPRLGTLFIPNTVAILRGSPNPDGARRLVDYLLSAEVEKMLAESASYQVPLNPNVQARLPEQIQSPMQVHAMDVDFVRAADMWDETQAFLIKVYARPR